MDSKVLPSQQNNSINPLITAIFETNSIGQFYKQIHKNIDEMDMRVEQVIKKHEGQFLLAYRNHIKKLKKELGQIKQKSEDQQKMFSSNDRIQYLQKQMSIFRQQALKLYDKLEIKTQEAEMHKAKIKQLEREYAIKDKQAKQIIKVSKLNEATKIIYEGRINQLQEIIRAKNQQINKLKSANVVSKNTSGRVTLTDGFQLKLLKNNTQHRHQSVTKPLKSHLVFDGYVHDSELKQWFLSCIRTVKKQVAQRKTYSRSLVSDLGYIRNIDEFRMVDKLRLLEIFLENEKLLVWMYQKIFPDRLQEIKGYLSQSHREEIQPEQNAQNKSEKNEHLNDNILPQVKRPTIKSEIRNKITIKNGKLNLSAV